MRVDQHRVVVDPKYKYKRLDPLPSPEELEGFYRDKYYDLAAAGGRAPDINRILKGGEEAEAELAWLDQTLWSDIKHTLDELIGNTKGRRLLDIGCGTGHFGAYMADAGWDVVGIEPSKDSKIYSNMFQFKVYSSMDECIASETEKFDAVTSLNVLEHVSDPINFLKRAMHFVSSHGILIIRVPNDFTSIQEAARQKFNMDPWWIAFPDHINYFNFESLERLLEDLGVEILVEQGDFPMEMFLLFGDNYVGEPKLGSICHRKRKSFELSTPANLRRDLYRCFARNGIGRNSLIFAKLLSPCGD